ncbi:MAG: hypothetical protein OXD54_17275 [Candidatus Poribacteria bacterium]|nr:hypothetical protein [Candidatus Poribacteria bacterium]
METVLDDETREIYKTEIEALIQRDEKYISISPDELDAIVEAFDFTLKNGREKVRAQMLYDLIQVKKEK